jgi:hypothetical protein
MTYDEEMDALDAAVFNGELLITHLKEFKEYLARWQQAVEREEKV